MNRSGNRFWKFTFQNRVEENQGAVDIVVKTQPAMRNEVENVYVFRQLCT